MREIYKKIEVKNRVYKKAYKSVYSKKIKWRIILPNEVYIKMIDSLNNNKPLFNFDDEKGLYILSLISSLPSYKKDTYYPGGYVNLNSTMLKDVVGNNYKKYLDYFVSNDIIERNNSYSNSEIKPHSKSFRYNLKGIKKLTWNIFEFDIIDTIYNKIELKEKYVSCVPSHLTKWLNTELTIDSDSTLFEIQEKLKFISSEENNTLKKAENYLRSLKNIHFAEYWAKRSPKDNRLHTNLTNMPEFFRKHIRYNDWYMAEVDFKNSQPFFLIVLIDSIVSDRKDSNYRILNIVEKLGVSGTMFHTLVQALNSKGFQEEYSKIKADVLNGTLYDNLERSFEFDKNIEGKFMRKFFCNDSKKQRMFYFDSKRDVVKRLFLFFLYKANKKSEKQEDNDYLIFKNLYPNFCHVLELLKDKNSKDLPKLLQHIEADCILDFTTKKIAEKYPHIPLFTIHDSIITTENYIDIIEKETKQYVKEYCMSLLPTLKTKHWCQNCEILKSA